MENTSSDFENTNFEQTVTDNYAPVKSEYLDDFSPGNYDQPPAMRLLSHLQLIKNQKKALSWTVGSFSFGVLSALAATKGFDSGLTFNNIVSTALSTVAGAGATTAGIISLNVYKAYAKEILYRLSKVIGPPDSPPPPPLEMRLTPPEPPPKSLTMTMPPGKPEGKHRYMEL